MRFLFPGSRPGRPAGARRSGRRQPEHARHSRVRPALEWLEGRCLPSTVTNLDDSGDGSLRQALLDAPSGGVVDFQPGLSGTITLTSGELTINNDVTIAGLGADLLTVSGNHLARVLNIASAVNVAISGLTIANGQVARGVNGGGIYNAGMLTVAECTVSANTTPAVVSGGIGGGIYNSGTLTVVDSTVSDNVSSGGGGIFSQGTLTVIGSTFTNNFGIAGGGIENGGNPAVVTNSIFRGNTARGEAGGGAGIENFGTMTVTGSAFDGNVATDVNGGGIHNSAGTLSVSNSEFSDNSAFSGGAIYNGRTVTITASTFNNNSAVNVGGGIDNDVVGVMTVTNSTLTGNSALMNAANFGGGGIVNLGALTLSDSTLRGNFAVGAGGGIDCINTGGSRIAVLTITNSTLSDNSAGAAGGAIFMDTGAGQGRATLTITRSTLRNNSAGSTGGAIDDADSAVTITDSTLSNNSAADGGAINNHDVGIFNTGTVTVTNSTLSGNSATQTCGGLDEATTRGRTTIRNSIVAGNTAPSSPDVCGSLVSQGHNLIGDGSGASGFADTDLVGTQDGPIDPFLGPLQDNGGPTETMAPLPGSPALITGDSNQLGVADQRGVLRSGGVNIGAYQASASALVLNAPAKVTAGVPFDLTVTAVDPFGQLAAGYTGTVTFATTDPDPGVVLPANYAFTAADGGTHTFAETTLLTRGHQVIAVSDLADSSITGITTVKVRHMRRHDGETAIGPSDAKITATDRFFATPAEESSSFPLSSRQPGQDVLGGPTGFPGRDEFANYEEGST